MIQVLFVCLGNICRSPMAEAVFRKLVDDAGLTARINVKSAGTGGWHAGEKPHRGTIKVLQEHNIDIGNKRAQQLTRSDIDNFNYIVAMDRENVNDILTYFDKRVPRLLEFAQVDILDQNSMDVPDPYYFGNFDEVYRLVTVGCQGLLEHIRKQEKV